MVRPEIARGRWWWPPLYILASVALLTLAFAPVGQFYLAWVGLAPWLVMVAGTNSRKAAFFWSWLAGTIFFTANMWWMANISVPGMIALMVYCGVYWGIAGLAIQHAGLLHPQRRALAGVFGVAALWVACEWLRGNMFTGLPWLFMGHTQTPVLAMCQVADVASAYGVSLWVVAVNVLAALGWIHRKSLGR